MEADNTRRISPPFVHSAPPVELEGPREVKAVEGQQQGWQLFDWRSAASLRAPESSGAKAEQAWDSTDWGGAGKSAGEGEGEDIQISPAAQKIAQQLDAVAQKIRRGELSVEGNAPPTPETAMVAALEALIRAK